MNISLLWLEKKYVGLLSSRLPYFKEKGGKSKYLANFRCVICGDSKSNKRKTRGYIGEKDGKLFYYCHNCGASMTFNYFLSLQDDNLYKDFIKERYIEIKQNEPVAPKEEISYVEKFYGVDSEGPLKHLQKISHLEWNHPAKKYVMDRKIPLDYHQKLRYTPAFNKFVNSLMPAMDLKEKYDCGRLIIPFLDKNGDCFGFQGRAFDDKALRYITIMLTNKMPKIFGLDTVDFNKKVYVLEGCIDAMFIDNSLAVTQGDLLSVEKICNINNCVFIPDKDVRNKEIMIKTKNLIDKNLNVCMLPESFNGKDINNAIINGMQKDEIMHIINENTFKGMHALLHFSKWSKFSV